MNLLKSVMYLLWSFTFLGTIAKTPEGENEKIFHEKRLELDQAIENRNFQEAKQILNELFPIMKKDIKDSKKRLSQLQKATDSDEDLSKFSKILSEKEDLVKSMQSLVKVSPAALRAQSDRFVKMIRDYDNLIRLN
ncbi:MAG: hypothetical protein MI865_09430 [Proteobacteria bacterium]|nr:hypothetical protein [Pseudomonadota bacterium]